jgi:hypothetical protein
MKAVTEFTLEDYVDLILPSQYDDLVRRRSPLNDGEGRLLWAVLEEAIGTYRASRKCSTPIQRETFQEVCSWFEPNEAQARSRLSFQTICEVLGIDPGQLLERLKSLDAGEFPRRRYRPQRNGRPRILATDSASKVHPDKTDSTALQSKLGRSTQV